MNNRRKNNFIVLSGEISKLEVTNGEKYFILSRNMNNAGGVAAVGLALIDMVGPAVTALQSSIDTGNQIQYFYCSVDNKDVIGCIF